jgi:hypothetical protein
MPNPDPEVKSKGRVHIGIVTVPLDLTSRSEFDA